MAARAASAQDAWTALGHSHAEMAAQVAPLLQKLDPMSMMEDGGLQKATIAIKLLGEKVKTDASTTAGIVEADGVLILLQTALLHPVPELREGAIVVIAGCVRCADNGPFLDMALQKNLPAALVRLCSEQDRRAKRPDSGEGDPGEEKAYDPDLPVRRVAVDVLSHVLLKIDAKTTLRVLGSKEWQGVVGTCFALIGNSDTSIRGRGAALLTHLLGLPQGVAAEADGTEAEAQAPVVTLTPEERTQLLALVHDYAGSEAEKAAAVLTLALSDDEERVRSVACGTIRALKPSGAALRDHLIENNAVVAAAALGAQAADVVEWLGGVEAVMRAEA